ncbi:carbohydrate kinase family protein [Streptomyces sp. NBC_01754]|uniref:carbohydrate kinase family protein n=1 Tax=Streptomyces sp. NBC_01754 TaxID=2975930 RepID=UPI002DDC8197|nr:carbohydrate kinase family protein [Streptomyces sp. NBC_01754]WSC92666.1 carbohydrate kinase family protein [Streptomyces sp. NBC_01754]
MDHDILVIGGSGIDTIVRVDELKVPDGDSVGVPPIRDYVAHTGNGVALGFHALGLRTMFIDYLGDDRLGRQILDRYASAGLAFDHLTAPAGTPRSVNLVDREGRRFSFYDGRHPEDLLMPVDFYGPHLDRAGHVHVSRSHFTREIFGEAVRRGRTVSTDLHAWDGKDTSAHPWAYGADFVFMSAATVKDHAPDVLRQIVARGRARIAVATDGAEGCHVLEREGTGEVRHFPAVRPESPVVDSNGAGDGFLTAFLYTLLGGGTVEQGVRAGSVSGAFACGHHGTHEVQLGRAGLEKAVLRAENDPRPA